MSYNQEQKQDRRTLLWSALAILAVLNVVLLYFFYQERSVNDTKDTIIAAKTEEVLTTKLKLDSISNQLDLKIAQIQQLGGRVDSLLVLKRQLENDRQSLKDLNSFSIKKYDERIKSYEATLREKDEEIVILKQELEKAAVLNQELSDQVSGLENERSNLGEQIESANAKNLELEAKVTKASALRAEKIEINAVSIKGKERDGGKYKSKRIDQIKVNFELAENEIAEQNDKDIYLRVLDPDGAVLSDMATGSGSFIFNGRETIFSSKQKINFTNTRQPVTVVYGRGGMPMKEGRYSVELYSEGFKIGQSHFDVK